MRKTITLLLFLILGFGESALWSSSYCYTQYYGCRARAWQDYFNCISRNVEESICDYFFNQDLASCSYELYLCLLVR